MTHDAFFSSDWSSIVDRLGGAKFLESSAREAKAFRRARVVGTAADLLRLVLAYCLGQKGLRLTATWATAIGLVDISNVALLYRLRQCGDWLSVLIGHVLSTAGPPVSQGRLIRIIDGTAVAQAGPAARKQNKVWRIHSAFDLPHERFGHFELTDEHGAEQIDRTPVIKGEIRLADRAYLQPDRIAAVLTAGADIVVRAGWKSVRWQDAEGHSVDLIAEFDKAMERGLIDRPICIVRKQGPALALRLIAIKRPAQAAAEARRKARRCAQREGCQISQKTLAAAEWIILVTSLSPSEFTTADVLALYRLRWRIELAFKRLKSLVGLKAPPGVDERSAKPYVLAHLLTILMLEPLIDELEDSPPSEIAA